MAFTLNIRPDVAAKAIATDDPARYLAKRLQYRLTSASLPASLWFTVERSREGILHLHGAATCDHDPAILASFRAALRKAAGEWSTARQHQAHTSLDPDFGWAAYSSKELAFAIATQLAGPGEHGRYPFTGKPWFASSGLREVAKTRYEAKRALSLRQARNATSVITDLKSVDLDKDDAKCEDSPNLNMGSANYELPQDDGDRGDNGLPRLARPRTDDPAERRGGDPVHEAPALRAGGDPSHRRGDRPRGAIPARVRRPAPRPP